MTLPISGRSFSGQLDRCVGRHLPPVQKGCVAADDLRPGPARGSKCAIDHANFAVVQFFAFQYLHYSAARDAAGRVHSGDEPCL